MMNQCPQALALLGSAARLLRWSSAEMPNAPAMPGSPHLLMLGMLSIVCLAKVLPDMMHTEAPVPLRQSRVRFTRVCLTIGIVTASHPHQGLLAADLLLLVALWHHPADMLIPHAPCPGLLHMQTAGTLC